MPTAQLEIVQNQIVATGNPLNINLGFIPTRFEVINFTNQNSTANPGVVKKSMWNQFLADGSAYVVKNTAGAATDESSLITTNGFTPYDGRASVLLGPAITGTTITKANPAVCTAASHGLVTGDVVQISNNVVMKQLGGLKFTVTVTGANTFTIPINTNVANFTAETGFVARKVLVGPLYYPSEHKIVNISAANPAVVSTSDAHGYTVGQKVRIRVPQAFGMVQMNNIVARITAVTDVTFTLGDVNSSAFTAFGFPAASSVPFVFPDVTPVGEAYVPVTFGLLTYNNNPLDDATLNQQFQGISLGTSVCGAASDVLQYIAYRTDINA